MSWKKVQDQLPFKDGNSSISCLVYDIHNRIFIRVYNEYHKCWDDEDGDDVYCQAIGGKITHWMELPSIPQD